MPDNHVPDGFKETEIGPIPVDWEVVRLGEVVEDSFSGGTPSTKRPEYWNGNIPWTTSAVIGDDDAILSRFQRAITELGLERSASKIAPKGSLMVGTRVGVGKAVVPEFDIAMSQDLTALVLKSHANALFLAYLFKSAPLQRQIQGRTRGTTIKGIPRKDLLTLVIPLPPLPEQRRIAHVLSTIQRAIAAQDKLIAAARELKRSLMRHLFTYGPVPLDQADQVPLKETEIGPVPQHWEVVRLGEVMEKPQYGYTASASEQAIGPKFLRITDIQDGRVSWPSVPFCKIDERSLAKYKLGPGDLLFARIGATTGKTYLVTECPTAVFASYLIRVCVKTEKLLPDYLHYFTHMESYWRQINAAKGGRLKKGINIPVLRSLLLPLPPLPEQRRIAHMLSAVDRKIEAEERRKAALQALFKSMLHQLMTGRIRVKDMEC